MEEEFPLFFCVTGLRGTRRTSVFNELKSQLPGLYPGLKYAFFEDPFEKLVHPLLWQRDKDPVSRLFSAWALMNERTCEITRAINAATPPDVIVIDGFGANAVLYATARVPSRCKFKDAELDRLDDQALTMHHSIVEARVRGQGVKPPEYIITCADEPVVTAYLKETLPDLASQLSDPEWNAFIQHEKHMLDRYFAPGSGQTCIGKLDAAMSLQAMVDEAMLLIHTRIAVTFGEEIAA